MRQVNYVKKLEVTKPTLIYFQGVMTNSVHTLVKETILEHSYATSASGWIVIRTNDHLKEFHAFVDALGVQGRGESFSRIFDRLRNETAPAPERIKVNILDSKTPVQTEQKQEIVKPRIQVDAVQLARVEEGLPYIPPESIKCVPENVTAKPNPDGRIEVRYLPEGTRFCYDFHVGIIVKHVGPRYLDPTNYSCTLVRYDANTNTHQIASGCPVFPIQKEWYDKWKNEKQMYGIFKTLPV